MRMAGGSNIAPTWGAQRTHAERLLKDAGSPAPQYEAAELLGRLLGVPVSSLIALPDVLMGQTDVQTYAAWVARRIAGVPIPYITGHLEFMGLDITVGWDSPLPSPGASQLVEAALQWARYHAPGELFAGEMSTGCGAVALALAALEPRFTRIYAVDASPEVLAQARTNGARYLLNLVITWLDGRDVEVIPEPVDLVVCSQPDLLSSGVALLAQAPTMLRPGGAVMGLFTDHSRSLAVASLARALPIMQVWTMPSVEGVFVAVAQLPRFPADPTGDATFTPEE
jgi:PrmC N-terminal domain/Methyltransferase domain